MVPPKGVTAGTGAQCPFLRARKSGRPSKAKKKKLQRMRKVIRQKLDGSWDYEKEAHNEKRKEETAAAGRNRTNERVFGIFRSTLVVHYEGRSGSSDLWNDGYRHSMSQYDRHGFRSLETPISAQAEPKEEPVEARPNTPLLMDHEDPGSWAD